MTDRRSERRIEDWLADELDAVVYPAAGVARALAETSSTPQIAPPVRWWPRFRGWLGPAERDGQAPPPDRVLTPGHLGPNPHAGAATTVPAGLSIPLVAVSLSIATLVILVFALAWTITGQGPSGAPGVLTSADPTPRTTAPPEARAAGIFTVSLDGSGDTASLEEAIGWSEDGDTIVVLPGEHLVSAVVDRDIAIVGEGDRDAIILRSRSPGDGAAVLYPSFAGEAPPGIGVAGEGPYVFVLRDTTARLEHLTIIGAEIGTAVAIIGGAPTITDVLIDPVGEQAEATSRTPHEAISFGGATRAELTDSTVRAFVFVGDGSSPHIAGNAFEQGCVYVYGSRTEISFTENSLTNSRCPNFAIGLISGATGTVSDNRINGVSRRADGIRIHGEGSRPVITGNSIHGGLNGIWVGQSAAPTIGGNDIFDTEVGIHIVGSAPAVSDNRIFRAVEPITTVDSPAVELLGNVTCDGPDGPARAIGPDEPSGSVAGCGPRRGA